MEKYFEKIINGETFLVKNVEWEKEQRRLIEEYRLKNSNLPVHIKDLNLKNYVSQDRAIPKKLTKFVENFDSKFKNVHLYFWSKENGTQKTTMAAILGKLLLFKGKSVYFVSMGDLIKCLQSENFDPENSSIVDTYKTCDFLIIDDCFDKRKVTIYKSGWQISFLDQFLRYRLETVRLSTCFTSNYAINEIDEDTFGVSLKKLIERSILDPFHFETLYQQRNYFDPSELWS